MSGDRVLITGATGAIAKWCAVEALKAGYRVRGTVRSQARAGEVAAAVASQKADASRLEIVVADLLSDAGWAEAMRDCRYVLHVASPFLLVLPVDVDELIRPARDGTLRVLKAAEAAGVARVVMTSSVAAVMYPASGEQSRTYDESDWTDPRRPDVTAYIASKALAERAAWEYVTEKGGRNWLTVINPGLVLGPSIDRDLSSSHAILKAMARGSYPAAPGAGYPIVDIRDVAAAHVRAMTAPAAAGQRLIAAEGYLTLMQISQILGRERPRLRWRLPWFVMHDGFVRFYSRFDPRLKAVLADIGATRRVSNAKAKAALDMTFRSADDAVVSAVQSLDALGVLG